MHVDIAITLLFSYYEEAKLTIEEISKNFQLLDSATSYFSNKM